MKVRINNYLLVTVLLFSFLNADAQYVVSYEKMGGADFSRYKTYGFYKLEVSNEVWESKKARILDLQNAIKNQMGLRGFDLQEEDPDLLINIGIVIEDKVQTRETSIREAPVYMGQRSYQWKTEEVVVQEYKEGSITLDFVDNNTDELVWQGVGAGVVTDNPRKGKKRIEKGVKMLFRKFPVDLQ